MLSVDVDNRRGIAGGVLKDGKLEGSGIATVAVSLHLGDFKGDG